jgi:hypothetical protein
LKLSDENVLTLSTAAVTELMSAVLEKGGLFGFRAHGTSMVPFLRDRDTLTIAPLANQPPRLGDVVAFSFPTEKGARLVVHRVVGRQGICLAVQGDGNGCTRETISPENILGRLVKVEREGKCVRVGLGPERWLIAWLSRTKLLWSLVWPVWRRVGELFKG